MKKLILTLSILAIGCTTSENETTQAPAPPQPVCQCIQKDYNITVYNGNGYYFDKSIDYIEGTEERTCKSSTGGKYLYYIINGLPQGLPTSGQTKIMKAYKIECTNDDK